MNFVEVVNFWKNSAIVLLSKIEVGNLSGPGKPDGKPADF